MKALTFLSLTIITFLFTLNNVFAQEYISRPVHIGLVYPVSSNGVDAAKYKNNFSFHALAGVSGAEEGFCLSGFANFTQGYVKGFQLAGFTNVVKGSVKGGQVAGFANVTSGFKGFQLAGFANVTDSFSGIQVGGFANVTNTFSGVQLSGFTGVANHFNGAQINGFVGVIKNLNGFQLSGFCNVAEDVKGTQLVGFVNVAKKVKGAQIAGFINIADSSDHPIGLINIIKNGEKNIGVSYENNSNIMLTFRSGGKITYGFLGAGYNIQNTGPKYVSEAGLGANINFGKYFRLRNEIGMVSGQNFEHSNNILYLRPTYRLISSVVLGNFIEFFAGTSLNYLITDSDEIQSHTRRVLLEKHYTDGNHGQLYLNYIAGINYVIR